MWMLLVLAILILLATLPKSVAAKTNIKQVACGINEEYYDARSSPSCDINCRNLQRDCQLTVSNAVAGCYCRAGFVRNARGLCVHASQCERNCPRNERHIDAMKPNICEHICLADPKGIPMDVCYDPTLRLCICKVGYCRIPHGNCEPI